MGYITVLLALYIIRDFSIQKGDGKLLQYVLGLARSCRKLYETRWFPTKTSIVIVRNCLPPANEIFRT